MNWWESIYEIILNSNFQNRKHFDRIWDVELFNKFNWILSTFKNTIKKTVDDFDPKIWQQRFTLTDNSEHKDFSFMQMFSCERFDITIIKQNFQCFFCFSLYNLYLECLNFHQKFDLEEIRYQLQHSLNQTLGNDIKDVVQPVKPSFQIAFLLTHFLHCWLTLVRRIWQLISKHP